MSCRRGFGLLETIVALVLVALMLALVPRLFEFARRAQRSESDLERVAAIAAASDQITRLVSAARPAMQTGADGAKVLQFSGSGDGFSFVAVAPEALPEAGLAQFTIGAVAETRGVAQPRRDLVAKVRPYPASDEPEAKTNSDERVQDGRTALLIANIDQFSVRYFGATADGRGPPRWQDAWQNRVTLPQLVELTFVPAGNRSIGPRTFEPVQLTIPLRLAPPA